MGYSFGVSSLRLVWAGAEGERDNSILTRTLCERSEMVGGRWNDVNRQINEDQRKNSSNRPAVIKTP